MISNTPNDGFSPSDFLTGRPVCCGACAKSGRAWSREHAPCVVARASIGLNENWERSGARASAGDSRAASGVKKPSE
ncbi:hypothetical protein MHYP_G00243830 [Metynnis hypsauchen]